VIITHHLALAMDLCDRAIFLQAGRKVETFPCKDCWRTGTC
jgi:ABC-type glutathione transport system ATPase component